MTTSVSGSSVHALLRARAEATPDAVAILAPGRAPLNFARLMRQLDEAALALNARGVRPGDRVAVVLPNGPEMALSFFAIASTATCAPLNPNYRASEYDFYLEDLNPRVLVAEAGGATVAREVAARRGIPVIDLVRLNEEPAGSFELRGEGDPAPAAERLHAAPEDVALVLHSSGTTARPKMVPLSHVNLCASARNIAAALELTERDRCLNVMPLFHIHGLVGATLSTLAAGGSLVCSPGFSAPDMLDWIAEFRPSWYTAVPTMHQALLARAAQLRLDRVETSLRFIRSCSSSLPPQVMAGLEALFGVPVVEAYGMTEAAHQMACNPLPPRARKPGSVGVATGPEIGIMDEAGEIVGPDRVGEVVIRGENVTSGYLGNPEANQKSFTAGWFRTGDQGNFDAEGYLFLRGRTKEMINRGGEKISPREIDEVLMDHPAVAEALAFALPDSRLGEDVGAAVVLRPGASVDDNALREFAAVRLADFKLPRRFVFLDVMPKGATGKPQRIGLAAKLGIVETEEPAVRAAPEFVAPRTAAEQALAASWRQVLRLEKLGVHDDFFDLGGDSLSAVKLLLEIEQTQGAKLSVADLFGAPTIARLAVLIAEGNVARARPRMAEIQAASGTGARAPFFCIAGGPLFRDLALRLGPDQPFLAPQYPDLDQLPSPCRLEDIAAYHVQTIRAAQPHGPYSLGGWCIDGLVALEVAQQLRAQGEEVKLLVMFDTVNTAGQDGLSRLGALRGQVWDQAEKLRFHLKTLSGLKLRDAPSYVTGRVQTMALKLRRRAVQMRYEASLRLNIRADRALWDAMAIQHRAGALYVPRPYDGPVLLVRRTLRPGGRHSDLRGGWSELLTGRFEVCEIPGDHRDMFLPPQVDATAEAMRARLRGVPPSIPAASAEPARLSA